MQVNEDLDRLVYHNGQLCEYDEEHIGESISIATQGTTKVEAHYGFSLIATWTPGSSVKIHQAAGFSVQKEKPMSHTRWEVPESCTPLRA